ncbi:Bacterial type II secretion system protein F domain protein [Mycobacterium basiliense]|uniref:Bacterial type II secretion system protein F domain protein n=1 Tax=Mycobacterium basiliense TaxID=2094119 RepID=A0A3S4BLN6_9MYCO|nr:type II secretion system F family protein [Mycobacterium basiliense]VDM90938.1 Bacterial type II secretion system protein F domain protein [Mycobacterium basiliense]
MSAAAALLATALLVGSGPMVVRARAGLPSHGWRRVSRPTRGRDPLGSASSMDVLAVCLSAGMAVSTAASATARSAPPPLAAVLSRAADLLALGADPSVAWSLPDPHLGAVDNHVAALLRLARRSASSGAALADGVAELATQSRHDAAHATAAAAERAGVLIAAPLGLCFLPAFVCVGIVPVVAGLARKVFDSGLL